MQDAVHMQTVPVKVYRTTDRVMVAAPMPGLGPEHILVEVTADGRLSLHGILRGFFKGDQEVLLDEWNPGPYHRVVDLPAPVDGPAANLSYGNGVLVIALPVAPALRPAQLVVPGSGPDRGQRAGNAGHPPHAPPQSEKHH